MKAKFTLFATLLAAALFVGGCASTQKSVSEDSIGDYWIGNEIAEGNQYGFALVRVKGKAKNLFRAGWTLPRDPNYGNGNEFRLISFQKFPKSDLKVVTFERATGHIYRAFLTKDGTKFIEGTRGSMLGKLDGAKWELRLVSGKGDSSSRSVSALQPAKSVPNSPKVKAAIETAIRKAAGKATGELTVADLQKVKHFNLQFQQITDLTPLAGLTGLESLGLFGNQISDLTPLAGLTKLKMLDLRMNQITDVKPLAGMKELQKVYLYENQITDLKPFAGLKELKDLELGCNKVTDLKPLAGLTKLEWVRLYGNRIADLTPLAKLAKLQRIWIRDNLISDLTPLAGLKELKHVRVENNPDLTKGEIDKLIKALPAPKPWIENNAKK